MQGNLSKVLILAVCLMAVPIAGLVLFDTTFLLARPGQDTRATSRFLDHFIQVRSQLPETKNPGESELMAYLQQLKSIDASRTHQRVQQAFTNYVATVEKCVNARRNREDSTAVDTAWREAEDALNRTARRHAKRRK